MKLHVEIRNERFTELLDPTEELEQLETGFDFVEGPIWNPIESSLIFIVGLAQSHFFNILSTP